MKDFFDWKIARAVLLELILVILGSFFVMGILNEVFASKMAMKPLAFVDGLKLYLLIECLREKPFGRFREIS